MARGNHITAFESYQQMVLDLFFSDKGDKSNVFKLHEELANPYCDCLQKGVFLCLIFGTTGVGSARSR